MAIYGKNPLKSSSDPVDDFDETFYIALGTPAIIVCSNYDPVLT